MQFIGIHGCLPDTQNIPLNQLRPCQPCFQTDWSAQYADGEPVEVASSRALETNRMMIPSLPGEVRA